MPYFKHAKSNCCNYSETGAEGKRNYCWEDGIICNLHPSKDLGCYFYVNEVLPYFKKLAAQWREENPPMGMFVPVKNAEEKTTDSKVSVPKKTCVCGKKFTPTNNRQKTCKSCSTPKLKMRRLRAIKKEGV